MTETAYHYSLIRRALEVVDAGGPELPLAELAARLGLSPAHFQRLFSRWVGISPKRYRQYLDLGLARQLLAGRHSVIDTAAATGLSGSGRLHDLFLTWEAMSPGEYARAGAGLEIGWTMADSPYGPALVMATGRGICAIAFTADTGEEAALADLAARWPKARCRRDDAGVAPLAEAAFAGGPGRRVALHLMGAPFHIKVWEALLAIPPGHVATYSDIAAAVGHPRAQRAVGSAVGRNPVSLLIPCHRALRRDGGLGGYHWGVVQKRAMLAREAARSLF